MVINEDFSRIHKIVVKQQAFLNSNKSQNHFEKEHYSFTFSNDRKILNVSLLESEQSSGTCWDDHLWPAKEYKILTHKVKRSIRVVLSAVLPKNNKSETNILVQKIFDSMDKYDHTETGFYGNFTKTKNYRISLEEIIRITKKHFS